jgi:2-polyprenyl-3-methyl-5-hydroxy-6-metoxy-1,4-benzoquinol methylase
MNEPDDMRREALRDDQYAQWKRWDSSTFGQWSRSDARYYAWHLRRCFMPSSHASPLRILEIGFGNGSFIGWARQQGHEVIGVEVQPLLRERALKLGWQLADSLETAALKAPYDLIAAFDVLEHIVPAEWPSFMGGIAAQLSARGRVLIRVPNCDSPFGRLPQHGDITHAATFGLEKLRQLAALYGLELVIHGDAPWQHRQGASRTLTNALRTASRAILEAWIHFAYAWAGVSLAPNLVVVLRSVRSPEHRGRAEPRNTDQEARA